MCDAGSWSRETIQATNIFISSSYQSKNIKTEQSNTNGDGAWVHSFL